MISRLGLLWRGLLARRGVSAMIGLVAVIATAAAAAGPTYYFAARQSILADALHSAPTIGQGIEVTSDTTLSQMPTLVQLTEKARKTSATPALFDRTLLGQELQYAPTPSQSTHLAWREYLCSHLRMVTGRCPRRVGDVVVSRALAKLDDIGIGDRLNIPGMRVVGIYEPIAPESRYWFNRGYFPQEGLFVPVPGGQPVDALFTVRATFDALPPEAPGTCIVDLLLHMDAVTPDQAPALESSVDHISTQLSSDGASPLSGLKTVVDDATASWSKLLVPVVLITAQLLALVWLLLFLVITEAAELRGPDLALAKVRGLSRLRTLRFGLTEPVTLLLFALPAGVALGWVATLALAGSVLRPGTPVTVGPWTIAAAAVAVSGGLVAAALAARRIVARPVVEQWRRTGRGGLRRGWALDIGLLVATGAGLVELYVAGAFSSASTDVLALLVPGLVGLAVAVLVARMLPWACRRLFRPTSRHGHIGGFLAVRQVARRPAGMRTLTVLAASFALACFSISAWSVTRSNIADVAATSTGAAAVLDVAPPPGRDLSRIVDRLDRSGTKAMAVYDYTDLANSARQTLAVDPDRWAKIVYWRSDFARHDPAALATRLDPPAPDPILLEGDRLRVSLAGVQTHTPGCRKACGMLLQADLKVPQATAETPVTVGLLRPGTDTLQTRLTGCPCVLRGLELTTIDPTAPAAGHATIARIETHTQDGWQPVEAGLSSHGRWTYTGPPAPPGRVAASMTAQGLQLHFDIPVGVPLSWAAYAWPHPLPAIVTRSVADQPGDPIRVAGLDGQPTPIRPLATVAVPGAPENAVVLDRTYAQRAAFDTSQTSAQQVWLAPGAVATFPARLRQAGVRVLDVQTAAHAARLLGEQGPALAILLFLADACAAALLAALGAVAGLHLSGRRRRYEIAALRAAGAPRRPLRTGLLLEQAVTLGLGVVAGVGAGLLAVYLAVPAVPEFVQTPAAPPLLYRPDWLLLAVPLAAVVVAIAVICVVSSFTLVAGAHPEQLREDPA